MELKYKKWDDISVELFDKIKEVLNKKGIEDIDKNISIVSILCEKDEDEISNLPIAQFSKLVEQTAFLNEMPKVEIKDKYIINGKKYNVFTSLKKMTTAQYIDFQTLQKNYNKNLKYLLAVFLIPDGKEYGDYDIDEVADELYRHLSIADAESIMFFFVMSYRALMQGILTYSISKMKKEMRKTKDKILKIKIGRAIIQMNQMKNLVKNGGGYTI
jgi:hypothetical protein